jgi:hypothetical protein
MTRSSRDHGSAARTRCRSDARRRIDRTALAARTSAVVATSDEAAADTDDTDDTDDTATDAPTTPSAATTVTRAKEARREERRGGSDSVTTEIGGDASNGRWRRHLARDAAPPRRTDHSPAVLPPRYT